MSLQKHAADASALSFAFQAAAPPGIAVLTSPRDYTAYATIEL